MRASGLPLEVRGIFAAKCRGPVVHKEHIGLFDHGLDVQVWEIRAVEAVVQLLYPPVGLADNSAKRKHFPIEW